MSHKIAHMKRGVGLTDLISAVRRHTDRHLVFAYDGLVDARALRAISSCPTSSRTEGGKPNISDVAPTSSIRKVCCWSSCPTLMAVSGSGTAPLGGESHSGGGCRRFASQLSTSMMLTRC